jgi:hypothetical protein
MIAERGASLELNQGVGKPFAQSGERTVVIPEGGAMRQTFTSKIKVYGNTQTGKTVARLKTQIKTSNGNLAAILQLVYGDPEAARLSYAQDPVQSITTGDSDCDWSVETTEEPPYTFVEHLTACLSRFDHDVTILCKSYKDEQLKVIAATSSYWYDPDRASDFPFFEDESDLFAPIQEKRHRHFNVRTDVTALTPAGQHSFWSAESYVYEGLGRYFPDAYYELSREQVDSCSTFPIARTSYDIDVNDDSSQGLSYDDFLDFLLRYFKGNGSKRIFFTLNKIDIFKQVCGREAHAYFYVSCDGIERCESGHLEFCVDKEFFQALMDGRVEVSKGKRFVVYGDVVESLWLFNFEKANHLKVLFLDEANPREKFPVFSGPLSAAAATLL